MAFKGKENKEMNIFKSDEEESLHIYTKNLWKKNICESRKYEIIKIKTDTFKWPNIALLVGQ